MKKRSDGRKQVLFAFLPVFAVMAALSGCTDNHPADATAVSEELRTESPAEDPETDTGKNMADGNSENVTDGTAS